ncbi:phosphonate C-P lyase system protein PhnH [Sinomonas albida]|uniref:phosphonate C-P lyase system protein PhnH n=1 Tax=Sinomonas albida TaxID=369942 RepID=UPI0010A76BD0|nr:phosphonate C-P lyase system protein PhnH [Sinomonas albida]
MTSTAGNAPAIPAPGFSDATRDAQRAFRAILDALSHPTQRYPLNGPAHPPAALGSGLAAVALTVLDEDSTVWLGGALDDREVAAWLDFHTGARRVGAASADFVFAAPASLPALGSLRLGTDEAPHLSTTAVLDVRGCQGMGSFTAEGPGINGSTTFNAPWADGRFAEQWRANTAVFPRGVDLLLVDADEISALPRTTRLAPAPTDGQEAEQCTSR